MSRLLGGLTPSAFLKKYWQKQPLVVRGAFPEFRDPISPAGLLRLARDPDVESRLVLARGGARPYQATEGPPDARRLRRLPASHWTLLVRRVDQLVPGASRLLDSFDFIPRWRVDDVMVSLAARGGGVGPHLDNYDVFLLQGRGRRRWRVQSKPDTALRPGLDLRVLRRFRPHASWVLEPGDMLYVPPGVAHEGVALEECLTYSIGFRAPSARALLASFAEHAVEALSESDLFADPDLRPTRHPGEVSPRALSRMQDIVGGRVKRLLRRDLRQAFLAQLTAGGPLPPRAGRFRGAALPRGTLVRCPASRAAYARAGRSVLLAVNGRVWRLDARLLPLARLLADQESAPVAAVLGFGRAARYLLVELVNDGAYAVEPAARSSRR